MKDEFISACEAGNSQLVHQLLLKNRDIVNADTGWGTVLHLAAENGDLDLCKVLISFGADTNATDPDSGYTTPLVEAAEAGHLAVAKLLYEAGAFVDGVDESTISPLLTAVDDGHHLMVEYLLSNGADVNRLDHIRKSYALDFANRRQDKNLELILKREWWN